MITLLYDGSFDGLLCALSAAIRLHCDNIGIRAALGTQLSFSESLHLVTTSDTLAAKIDARITERFGQEAIENIYTAFLYPNSEDLILYYLCRMIESSSAQALSHPHLIPLQKRIRSVLREVHAFKGFLRFRQIAPEVYYADYEPTYDISALLMPHFIRRFPNQKMIVHDIKHSLAAMYDGQQLLYTSMTKSQIGSFNSPEDAHSALWKRYLEHLSIEERKNSKLQRSLMPLKYRKYMTENQ